MPERQLPLERRNFNTIAANHWNSYCIISKKDQTFSGCVDDEDWMHHFHQFKALAAEYLYPIATSVSHFQYCLKKGLKSFKYYIKHREGPGIKSEKILNAFQTLYHWGTKRARESRQLKDQKLHTFADKSKSNLHALRKLSAKIEHLANIAHDEDRRKHALWTVLW